MSYLEEQALTDRDTDKYEEERRDRNIHELINGLDRIHEHSCDTGAEYEYIDYDPIKVIADVIISKRKVIIPTTLGLTQQMTVGAVSMIAVCHIPRKAIVTATGVFGGSLYTLVAEVDSRDE